MTENTQERGEKRAVLGTDRARKLGKTKSEDADADAADEDEAEEGDGQRGE